VASSVWKNIGEAAEETDRHQFISVKLPDRVPTLSDFRRASLALNQTILKIFNSQDAMFLLEVWKWLGEDRSESLLNHVSDKRLDRVNLIFTVAGRWSVMNLGIVNSWRIATDEELQKNPEANKEGLPPKQLQLRFMRYLMALQHTVTLGNLDEQYTDPSEAGTPGNVAIVQKNNETEPNIVKIDVAVPKTDVEKGVTSVTIKKVVIEADTETNNQQMDIPTEKGSDIKVDPAYEEHLEREMEYFDSLMRQAAESQAAAKKAEDFQLPPLELHDGVKALCDKLADDGLLSAAEYRRYQELAESYKTMTAPDGKTPMKEFIAPPETILNIAPTQIMEDKDTILDKSMLHSTLQSLDAQYVKHVMPRDVAAMVMNVQNMGICVTDYKVERVDAITGSFDSFTIKAAPVEGSNSTLRFKLPAVDEDGTYLSGGIKYRMRRQIGDLPIRKIGPDRVALNSYYGKLIVSRSEKKVNNYVAWLANAIMLKGLDDTDQTVTSLHPSNVFDNLFPAPRLYSGLAMNFRGFTLAGFDWNFDRSKRLDIFHADTLDHYEKDGSVCVGKSSKGDVLVMDKNGALYRGVNGDLQELPSIEDMLDIAVSKAPTEFVEVKVLGKAIPLGLLLGYELGLENLMTFLKVEPRRVASGERANLQPHEFSLVFSDETLVFSRDDRLATMVLAGFNEYHRAIRDFGVYDFDRKGVYLNVLETAGIGVRFLREIDLLYAMFIDPITRRLLVQMKEPVEFRALLMRACRMLLVDHHPDEGDSRYQRIRGYDRMAGAVYSELVKAIRMHGGRSGKSKHPIDLNPYAVWTNIAQDPSIALVSDINPIQNLKEQEAVTYAGTGGRNSRSMTKRTRAYHNSNKGTISESTVDSSDVGINIYTSANPQFTTVYGTTAPYDKEKTGPSSLFSTASLVSVAADQDDAKRTNFIGIQHSHGLACDGYHQSAVRTGYEQVLTKRTSDLFAFTARKPGMVLSMTETSLLVEYEDGERKGFELGRRYGHAAGLIIPHSVVSDLKQGQKFKEGTLLCYNDGFFEKDILDPNNVIWKAGVTAKIALLEAPVTHEDSSAISQRLAELLKTKTTKVKKIVVSFDQSVRKLIKVGQHVEAEDILCIIEEAVTANNQLFDEESIETLRKLGAMTPEAHAKGTVERIDVFYHGDEEDMSESLRTLTNATDRELLKRNKELGRPAFTGAVDESYRVDGNPLQFNTLVIEVYITGIVAAGVGD